jgi:hypothetical protein
MADEAALASTAAAAGFSSSSYSSDLFPLTNKPQSLSLKSLSSLSSMTTDLSDICEEDELQLLLTQRRCSCGC